MIPILNKKTLIYVSSAIDIDDFPNFNYGSRSVFDRDRRLSQTLLTIKNLKYFFPESDIIIFDAGKIYNKAIELINNTNNTEIYFLKNISDNVYQFSRKCSSKGLCETVLTLEFLREFGDKISEYEYFIKFSGRYIINKFSYNIDFSDSFFTKNIYKFKYEDNKSLGVPKDMCYDNMIYWAPTLIYGLPVTSIEEFNKGMIELYNFYNRKEQNFTGVDYEILFYNYIVNPLTKKLPFKEIDVLIEGRIATTGEIVLW